MAGWFRRHILTNFDAVWYTRDMDTTIAPRALPVRADGAAVNWRELHGGASELLVKSIGSVILLDRNRFISGASAS